MTIRAAPLGLAVILALLAPGSARAEGAHPAWGYHGDTGPAHWGALDPGYAACAAGRMQSPIDLTAVSASGLLGAVFHYVPAKARIHDSGHGTEIALLGGGHVAEGGVRYDLRQVHFHSPSEHRLDGVAYPFEAHLVHRSDEGALLVLGVFFAEGAAHPALDRVLAALDGGDPGAKLNDLFDPGELLPAEAARFRYMGSLTTPPCTEGVNWHVAVPPATASAAQIARLQAALGDNARPVQARGDRLLIGPEPSGSR